MNERLPTAVSDARVADAAMIDALSRVPLFEGLDRAELAPLAGMTHARRYGGNVIVVSQGDRADTLYFVLAGRIKVFVGGEDGRELVLNIQGPGTYFGDMILDDGVRSASVMTLEPCLLATLSRDVFRDFLKHHPDAALALIKILIRRTRLMNERVCDIATTGVGSRVAKLLLSLAHEVDGQLVVDERLTQQEIAERVAATREMVARVLKDLASKGHIRREGRGRIVILRKPLRG